MKLASSAQRAGRLAVLAAAVAIASGGYAAIASAGPQGCDPAIVANCKDPPPAQGPPPPRQTPGRLPGDTLPINPGPVECRFVGPGCMPTTGPSTPPTTPALPNP
jgi:hypothetical protein